MEWLRHITSEPTQLIYGTLALCGGIARYLNGVAIGTTKFNVGLFCASAFVSGFSGYMFALLGLSMQLPQNIVFILAGSGGFFGDQTMKLIYEWAQNKLP